jgi:hypothetical protein
MKKAMLVAGFATLVAMQFGCAHGPKNFADAVNQVIGAASGPCAQDLVKAAATCKQQYPGLPW